MDPQVAAAFIGTGGTVFVAIGLQIINGQERRQTDERRQQERKQDLDRAAKERRAADDQRERERREEREAAEQERREGFLFRALEHLGGGAQERSVGIAIAEGYWERVPEQIAVLVPVLLNQLVYLLATVDTAKSMHREHERMNVRRIIALLERIGRFAEFADSYSPAASAIEAARKPGQGLDLGSDSELPDRTVAFVATVRRGLASAQ